MYEYDSREQITGKKNYPEYLVHAGFPNKVVMVYCVILHDQGTNQVVGN